MLFNMTFAVSYGVCAGEGDRNFPGEVSLQVTSEVTGEDFGEVLKWASCSIVMM